jgi:signal transduction histidine kinase
MLHNAREGILEIVERRGPEYDRKRKHRRFKVGEGIAGWAAAHCKPYLSPDVNQEQLFKEPVGDLNFKSLLAVPILRENGAIGVICADSPEFSNFSVSHIEVLSMLAREVADKIEQLAVDTFISYKKRLKQLEALHEVGQEMSRPIFESPEELTKLLEHIAKAAERVLEADLVTLYQYDEQSKKFKTPPTLSGKFCHPEWMVAPVNPGDAPYLIVKERKPLYSEEAPTDKVMRAREFVPAGGGLPERPSFVSREGVCSSAGIPLLAGLETVGAMFINYREVHPFPEEEKNVIETFAAYAALAIQGARRLRGVIHARQEALQKSSRMVAHRLRNILPFISDRIERIMTRSTPDHDCHGWCQAALVETRHAQKIVRDFEKFSRAETFERPDILSGNELARKVSVVIQQNLTNGSFQMIPPPELPLVKVNFDRLSDDFLNFVRDSERHTVGDLRVTLSAEIATPTDIERTGLVAGKSYVKVRYRDNGPGIATGYKKTVFEPFYTSADGTGLGLSIAIQTAKVHEGALIECGQEGGGVCFEFYLPIRQDQPTAE